MQTKITIRKTNKIQRIHCLEINFIKICPEIALKYFFFKMWFYMNYIASPDAITYNFDDNYI